MLKRIIHEKKIASCILVKEDQLWLLDSIKTNSNWSNKSKSFEERLRARVNAQEIWIIKKGKFRGLKFEDVNLSELIREIENLLDRDH